MPTVIIIYAALDKTSETTVGDPTNSLLPSDTYSKSQSPSRGGSRQFMANGGAKGQTVTSRRDLVQQAGTDHGATSLDLALPTLSFTAYSDTASGSRNGTTSGMSAYSHDPDIVFELANEVKMPMADVLMSQRRTPSILEQGLGLHPVGDDLLEIDISAEGPPSHTGASKVSSATRADENGRGPSSLTHGVPAPVLLVPTFLADSAAGNARRQTPSWRRTPGRPASARQAPTQKRASEMVKDEREAGSW